MVFAIISIISQDTFHNARKVLQEASVSLNLLDKTENLLLFFIICNFQ